MKCNADFGDYVELILSNEKHKGVYLENENKSLVFLKLDNGYNIGFDKKEVLEIKKLKESKIENNSFELKKDGSKPNIAMIITGGTIAARLNPKKGGVDWLDTPESLFKFYPNIFEKVNVSKVDIPFMKASEDMGYKDWKEIAKSCEKHLNDPNISGVLVTHGTDFLHYTSSALSFFLGEVNKPVVLTYSQRSIDRASSDANLNLLCSVEVAGLSNIAEVMLVGHGSASDDFCYAMRGTKVRKLHSSRRDAFKMVNDLPFAKIYQDKIEILRAHKIRNKKKVEADLKFEEKIALLKFYPGQDPNILDFYLKEGYKGIVLEMGALGHVATSRSRNGWTKKLKEIISKGVFVCGVSQCINGRTDPLVYSNGREFLDAGVIYLEDMLSETAFVKLGWVLGHKEWSKDIGKVKEKMLHNFVGEISDRIVE